MYLHVTKEIISSGSLESTINILKDVDIVLVSQIGPGASQYLLNNGIKPFIMQGFIDEELNKLAQKTSGIKFRNKYGLNFFLRFLQVLGKTFYMKIKLNNCYITIVIYI